MNLKIHKDWTLKLLKREITFHDYLMFIIRRVYVRMQMKYNTHLKKVVVVDRSNGRDVGLVLLTGLYPATWDVVFRRVYEYADGVDVVVLNAGGFNRERAMELAKEYGFSYVEGYPNNYTALQNYYLMNTSAKIIIKMDDDVFLTKYTIGNLLETYRKLREEGYDVGFVAPVLNVNNVTYYHFLKTLGLVEEYERLFEKPIYIRNWTKQRVWYDPEVAKWLWENSLPLNEVAEVFQQKNRDKIDTIPVRFSIQLILYETSFLKQLGGLSSPGPKFVDTQRNTDRMFKAMPQSRVPRLVIPLGDEESINFFADIYMAGRFVSLSSFAGHLAYFPQSTYMIEWFIRNKEKFLTDIKR